MSLFNDWRNEDKFVAAIYIIAKAYENKIEHEIESRQRQ